MDVVLHSVLVKKVQGQGLSFVLEWGVKLTTELNRS